MGNSNSNGTSYSGGKSSSGTAMNSATGTSASDSKDSRNNKTKIELDVDDLEVQFKRGGPVPGGGPGVGLNGQPMMSNNNMGQNSMPQYNNSGPSGASSSNHNGESNQQTICRELFSGDTPLGARAFQMAGLIGTEKEQLSLLSYFATLSEDFRRYQEQVCRIKPQQDLDDGTESSESQSTKFSSFSHLYNDGEGALLGEDSWPQLLLLSGPPGTGKTRHVLAWSRAMGLPLIVVDQKGQGWRSQVDNAVRGRDCIILFDELDGFFNGVGGDFKEKSGSKGQGVIAQVVGGKMGSSNSETSQTSMSMSSQSYFSEVDSRFPSQFRQYLDGTSKPFNNNNINQNGQNRVIVVGTTNAIHSIPKDVIHRAEVINFSKPEQDTFLNLWSKYAGHLPLKDRQDLAKLCGSSTQGGLNLTARDAKVCSMFAERHTAIRFLNRAGHGGGYAHGSSLLGCPGPVVELYKRCLKERGNN